MIDKLMRFMRKPQRDKLRAVRTSIRFVLGGEKARARLRFRGLITGALVPPKVLTGQGQFYMAYRPDWDVGQGAYPELAQLSKNWVANNVDNNAGDLPRLYALVQNLKQVLGEGIPGDLAELGVYRGNSAAVLAHYARAYGRQLHLFDTFEGFDRRDLTGDDQDKDLDFADTSLDLVQGIVGTESVRWIKGYFPASIPSDLAAATFSIVHLDCDLYEPMKAALDFFFPRLSPGGLLIIHDYCNHYWPGIQSAVDEFLSGVPERLVLMPDKSGTAMIRKS